MRRASKEREGKRGGEDRMAMSSPDLSSEEHVFELVRCGEQVGDGSVEHYRGGH